MSSCLSPFSPAPCLSCCLLLSPTSLYFSLNLYPVILLSFAFYLCLRWDCSSPSCSLCCSWWLFCACLNLLCNSLQDSWWFWNTHTLTYTVTTYISTYVLYVHTTTRYENISQATTFKSFEETASEHLHAGTQTHTHSSCHDICNKKLSRISCAG